MGITVEKAGRADVCTDIKPKALLNLQVLIIIKLEGSRNSYTEQTPNNAKERHQANNKYNIIQLKSMDDLENLRVLTKDRKLGAL